MTFIVGILSGFNVLATEGVMHIQLARKRVMLPATLFIRSSASGTQMQQPKMRTVSISRIEASNWPCSITVPLGFPVEPEVNMTYAMLFGLTELRGALEACGS